MRQGIWPTTPRSAADAAVLRARRDVSYVSLTRVSLTRAWGQVFDVRRRPPVPWTSRSPSPRTVERCTDDRAAWLALGSTTHPPGRVWPECDPRRTSETCRHLDGSETCRHLYGFRCPFPTRGGFVPGANCEDLSPTRRPRARTVTTVALRDMGPAAGARLASLLATPSSPSLRRAALSPRSR
jgi:hypothetical protein